MGAATLSLRGERCAMLALYSRSMGYWTVLVSGLTVKPAAVLFEDSHYVSKS